MLVAVVVAVVDMGNPIVGLSCLMGLCLSLSPLDFDLFLVTLEAMVVVVVVVVRWLQGLLPHLVPHPLTLHT